VEDLRKHKRRRIEQNSRAQQQVQAVENSRKTTHRLRAKPHLEKFVCTGNARRAETRDKHETHDDDTQESSYLEHEERHVVAVHVGGRTEESRRAYGSSDEANAHGDPRNGSATEHIFLEVLVATGNPETNKQRKQQVCRKNKPVNSGKHKSGLRLER